MDDGMIQLRVEATTPDEVRCRVVQGGRISDHKGLSLPGVTLPVSCLTDKDRVDLTWGIEHGVDFVAVSFVRSAADISEVRRFLYERGASVPIVAKLERQEAMENLPDILATVEAVMVARGDLGVDVPLEELPHLQKEIIRQARLAKVPVIVATQMLESMVTHLRPTRAEVSDVTTAIFDGADAVMLSAESASGMFPVQTIEAMDRICIEAEQTQSISLDQDFLNRVFTRVDQSIAMAALFTAFHLKVKAIAALTESGATALWMSRLNCGVPIYALTSQTSTRYRCALLRDTYPLMVKYVGHDREELLREAEKVLVDNGVVRSGDLIVLTIGEPIGKAGGTNTMKIVRVGEQLKG
jgi:pyruvate kinase